jgi:hypothetical protein
MPTSRQLRGASAPRCNRCRSLSFMPAALPAQQPFLFTAGRQGSSRSQGAGAFKLYDLGGSCIVSANAVQHQRQTTTGRKAIVWRPP